MKEKYTEQFKGIILSDDFFNLENNKLAKNENVQMYKSTNVHLEKGTKNVHFEKGTKNVHFELSRIPIGSEQIRSAFNMSKETTNRLKMYSKENKISLQKLVELAVINLLEQYDEKDVKHG